eukprot:TRINITY_DN1086_c0_g1_i12.p3 TRINITY_DN1086_c0_g1~~TRINITY_DN1086_c0_g1_i12.p3  ORF type:complete len:146 (-),score=55.82 TRINITY_DN1086_c0_g1_i12:715-1152(-)
MSQALIDEIIPYSVENYLGIKSGEGDDYDDEDDDDDIQYKGDKDLDDDDEDEHEHDKKSKDKKKSKHKKSTESQGSNKGANTTDQKKRRLIKLQIIMSEVTMIFFFFNDTATTEIYTLHIVGSVRCVQETVSKYCVKYFVEFQAQ